MRIGILTLPFNNNYGGYLQAYALMTVLKQMGHNVELIYRRSNKPGIIQKAIYSFKTLAKIILRKPHGTLIMNYERDYKQQGSYMIPFVEKYITPKTRPFYTSKQMKKECEGKYDVVVVGSDQVWRPIYVSQIEDFFFEFITDPHVKKIAYAASFGTATPEYTDVEILRCKKLIADFAAVSIREKSGLNVIKSFGWKTQTPPQVVLDPTFLLPKEIYDNVISNKISSVSKNRVDPPYTNWLLFSATVEAFLRKAGAPSDTYRIVSALRKVEEWYVGDGWYSDGPGFAFDYYNSFVLHPMYIEPLEIMTNAGKSKIWNAPDCDYNRAKKRMQRFGMILERFISPEGALPVFGRSITYRTGTLQPLALLAWRGWLPKELPDGQVRAAMTAVIKRMFGDDRNFNEKGFLTLGFNGKQPNISDWYTNNGSLYMASLAFLPLGLPADHTFWTSPAEDWTSKKAWEGKDFPKDHAFH